MPRFAAPSTKEIPDSGVHHGDSRCCAAHIALADRDGPAVRPIHPRRVARRGCVMSDTEERSQNSMIKVVYFDEESASDYLDISAGGKFASTSENVKDRTTKLHTEVEAKLAAKFSWLPFLGGSAGA